MAKAVNICHLRTGSRAYGAEVQIFDLCRADSPGFQMSLLFMAPSAEPHPLLEQARGLNIPADQIVVRGKFRFNFAKELSEYLLGHDISILHCHDYKSDILGFPAARRAGIPAVATAHGFTESSARLKLYKHLDLTALRRFDKIIAVSNWSRDNLIKLGVPGDKITTIYNGLDPGRRATTKAQQTEARTDLNVPVNAKLVVAIGRLSPEKNYPLLLKAFSRLVKDFPSAKLIIAGDGRQRQVLESLAAKLDIRDSVTFLGYIERVHDLIDLADCVAIPSRRETLSMVMLEAMSAGKVVVARKVGGIPEVIKDGKNGLLVQSASAIDMANRIKSVLDGSVDPFKLGAAARDTVAAGFTIGRMVEKTAALYQDVLETAK